MAKLSHTPMIDYLAAVKAHVLAGKGAQLVEHLPRMQEAWIPCQQHKSWVW